MEINFGVVIVVFNMPLSSSPSLQSMVKIKNVNLKLFVWDNSPHRAAEGDLNWIGSEVPSTQYIHTPENISLAKIYNEVTLLNRTQTVLAIFDQDSQFDESLFAQVAKSVADNTEINLFIPFVQHANVIFSPGNFHLVKGKYWRNLVTGKVKSKNTVAIASGMFIRTDFLIDNYPMFDERLKLYGIDSDFMLSYSKKCEFFFILNYNLNHHLSVNEQESIEKKLFRYVDMYRSTLLIARKRSRAHFFLARVYLWYVSLRLTIRFKDLRFFKAR